MAEYIVDRKQFGIKKEGTRGTCETAPASWLYCSRDSELNYGLEHDPHDRIAGVVEGEFAPEAGRKVGTGKWTMDLEAQTIGEVLHSLLGGYTGAQDSTTTAYTHTFTKTTSTQHQAYSLFVDRGVNPYGYALGVAKSLEVTLDAKGRGQAAVEWLFKSEQTRDAFSPSLPTPDPLMFYQAQVEIADTTVGARVDGLKLKIDNGAEAIWRYNQSQDCADIVVAKKLMVEGGFDMYFTSTAERADFLANTSRKIELNITGDQIGSTGSYFRFLATLYAAKYTAVPFDTELRGGLIGASMAFKGFYSISDSKALQIIVGNTSTTY
jgi:hypothetical protein